MDDFTKAYMEAALWSSTTDTGEPLDSKHGMDDFAPETVEQMEADCKAFQEQNQGDLQEAYNLYENKEWSKEAQAGHDFWLTRNRHGCGFWDRDLGIVGDRLTEASGKWGECHVEVGDDGRIYIL